MFLSFTLPKVHQLFYLVCCLLIALTTVGQEADTTIHIKAQEGLQFDIARFSLRPGAKVKLIVTNDDDMDHNLVIARPGTRQTVVQQALLLGEKGPAMYYVPDTKEVIWATKDIPPHQENTYYFTAPSETGIYPFICTYPGHGLTMYGSIYIGVAMPAIAEDLTIPASKRGSTQTANTHHHHATTGQENTLHPYQLQPPFLYRVFMPYSGPASIAVRLSDTISYCYDATLCRIRYAWSGGFLSNLDLFKNKKDTTSILQGEIFFKDQNKFPLEFEGINEGKLQFKGYKLVESGYPQFDYTYDSISITELTKPISNATGFITHYTVNGYKGNIKIAIPSSARLSSKQGKVKGDYLVIKPKHLRQFSITTEAL